MKVLKYPNPSLKRICQEVNFESPNIDLEYNSSINEILDQMKQVMLENNGMGLAANQVGLNYRIFIMKDLKNNIWEFINPSIIFKDDIQYLKEGCLSAPGVYIELPRAKHVTVKALNRNKEEFIVSAVDLEAVCIQHEIDHLDGIFYLDKLSRQQKRFYLKQIEKK